MSVSLFCQLQAVDLPPIIGETRQLIEEKLLEMPQASMQSWKLRLLAYLARGNVSYNFKLQAIFCR